MWDESKVRIVDIAKELGVSTATVSNVLHGKTAKVSDATVKRVEQKLEETGYIPNMAAMLLARNDSRIIGVIVNDHEKYEGHIFEDPFISAAVNYLYDEIENNGYFMLLKKMTDISEAEKMASMWNLDGMILIGFCEDDYQNLRDHIRIPFVVYDGYMEKSPRISVVMIDDFDGGRQVGEYLRGLGHTEVLCIADNNICMDLGRYKGLCEGMKHSADFMKIPMQYDKRMKLYDDQMNYIIEHSAVFAVSDYYAIELMGILIQKGVRIPEDLSIVGFDGSLDCKKCIPSLTSVFQDNRLRAKTAMELLLRMIAQPGISETVCLPVKLVEGNSSAEWRGSGCYI